MKKRVNITMEEWLLAKVDKLAKIRGLDRSTVLSIMAYDWLAQVDVNVEMGNLDNHTDALLDACLPLSEASAYMQDLEIK